MRAFLPGLLAGPPLRLAAGLGLALACLPACVSAAREDPADTAALEPAPLGDIDTAAPAESPPCVLVLDSAADTADTADTAPHGGRPTVVYAVRHAEKGSGDDPDLTEAGKARARALVDVMHDVPLVAVYATDLVRTQQTVAPTADDHGLPVVIDYDPEEELAAHILAENVGTSVLHAGHSYTLGDFMEALGVADPPSVGGYGDLWIITIRRDGTVTLETSCFGEME